MCNPKAFSGNEVRFDFSLIAPSTDVTLTLFGAGNSTNADLGSDGDKPAATKWSVIVGNGSPDPDTGNEDDESRGGCSTTGGTSVWIFALAGASLTLLRRRQG